MRSRFIFIGRFWRQTVALAVACLRFCTECQAAELASTNATPATAEKEFWSLAPLENFTPPRPHDAQSKAWARTPVDLFILDKLAAKNLQPNPPADKRTLLRRIHFDLIGLPPTPEEMREFLRDSSPHAYEKVVDRLLASPRYGERWARHWMDVAHYAETHGHDQDRPRTNAWPYRDYLIRSFNEDKPYARFVEEQIAGDVLFPRDPQGIVATGFLATGPWDESSLRDIREDTIDRQVARYLDRDDIVTTVMSTFTSTTVHCARCHDHKFDPIKQSDYYALQAVFAATDKGERQFDLDPETNLIRQRLLKQRRATENRTKEMVTEFLSAGSQAETAAWEAGLKSKPSIWTALKPQQIVSEGGATLTKLPDQSVLSSGTRPEVDVYTFVATTTLTNITAIRLEVLADESLPHQGPGRQDNGNLHLSEISLNAAPLADATATNARVVLKNASADFSQTEWGIERAIDGKTNTAWGIYPKVGESHFGVFETKENLGFVRGARLTFALEQRHGGGHLIGRFRISITTAERPVRANPFPENITTILALPSSQRSDEQRVELAAFARKEKIEQQLKVLPPPRLVYAGASEFVPDASFVPAKAPRPVHVLKRGDINKPGDEATPGALPLVRGLDSRFNLPEALDEGARRAALAKWITDPRNVLTWRSIVNRVWQYHFGRGLVDSPNDFGRMGARPTHPELLDWLAVKFQQSGGSFKQLHKLIVTSAVYRQSSQTTETLVDRKSKPGPDRAAIDADNSLLWRMNRARLDAESVRDAVLQITGKLDLTMGGPSVKQFMMSPGIHVTPVVDYNKFDVDSPESCRRSVYRFIFRTLPDPFMDSLDCADSSQLTAKRNVSMTSLQALAMLNNHFMVRQSEHFAAHISGVAKNLPGQIKAIYELALHRPPTANELKELAAYATKHGLANACRLILNSNEFMFVN
ncbi:MAG: DUF1549 domain-containing protein [Verrucomicrobia bacterium]|nr:DUF1549 domain-containing protein [Verrucomicrobiota bacterium]